MNPKYSERALRQLERQMRSAIRTWLEARRAALKATTTHDDRMFWSDTVRAAAAEARAAATRWRAAVQARQEREAADGQGARP